MGESVSDYTVIFKDANHKYTIEQILNNPQIEFVPITHSVEKIEFTNATYWVLFNATNHTEFDAFVLETARSITNKANLFEVKENKVIKTSFNGDDYSFSNKEVNNRLNVFNVDLKKGETKSFVLQLESDGETLVFPLIFHESHQFWEKSSENQFLNGIYYGVLLLVIIIYFFFYRLLLNRSFLYYILYVISIFLLQFSLDGYSFEYLFPNGGYLTNHVILFSASLTVIFVMLYAKTYLNTVDNAAKLNRIFNAFIVLMLILLVASLIPGKLYEIAYPAINGVSLISVILIIIAIFLIRKKGIEVSVYFTSAFVILIAGAIIFILGNFHFLDNDTLTSNSLKISSALEVIALSISMAYKYRELQNEKEIAQASALQSLEERNKLIDEQNIVLEKEVKERTKDVENQKEVLREKNEEILDSINYAKRLQHALIPPLEKFKQLLPNSFVLFEPKDIVSGDFYWISKVNTTNSSSDENESLIVFCAADCTGHGVPGAFMSIIGIQIFNQSMKNPDVNSTSEALDYLNKELYNTVNSHSEGESVIRDGMDLSLCAFNPTTLQLYYSGAKNPIYIVRDKELIEIKGDKQPIGSNENPTPFTQHMFQLEKEDMLFLFTDGLPDQFGGPKGKKFKYKQFQEVLIKNSELNLNEQHESLLESFINWKGSLEQLDDVCVIGVRI